LHSFLLQLTILTLFGKRCFLQLSMLTAMGFTPEAATAALKSCSNNVERAADWLFSHMDDLDAAVAAVNQEGGGGEAAAGGGAGAGGVEGAGAAK
jgi:ubiquitin carboxyl-terminal hydrolase 5/13